MNIAAAMSLLVAPDAAISATRCSDGVSRLRSSDGATTVRASSASARRAHNGVPSCSNTWRASARLVAAVFFWRSLRCSWPRISCVLARSNGIGNDSCSANARCAVSSAAVTSPRAASSIARHRAPTDFIQARLYRAPFCSSARVSVSASSRRPTPTIASITSGRCQAYICSVQGIRSARKAGSSASSASRWFPSDSSRKHKVMPGQSAMCDELRFLIAVNTQRASARAASSRPA